MNEGKGRKEEMGRMGNELDASPGAHDHHGGQDRPGAIPGAPVLVPLWRPGARTGCPRKGVREKKGRKEK